MSPTPDIDFRDEAKTISWLKEMAKNYPAAVGAAAYEEGLALQAESVALVPVDTGRLRATAFTSPPVKGPEGPTVTVGYGTDYAVYVHERTELHHDVGQSKFLEQPAVARSVGYADRMARRVKQHIEEGTSFAVLAAREQVRASFGITQSVSKSGRVKMGPKAHGKPRRRRRKAKDKRGFLARTFGRKPARGRGGKRGGRPRGRGR